MARRRQKNGRTIREGWYEGKVTGVPDGFVRFTNPQKRKLSSLV